MDLRRNSDSKPTPVYPTDRESLERDCTLEFVIASGPGGQHRNKTESGVRLTHRPSGTVVMATERRSQHQNREVAYERIAERLTQMQQVRAPRKATRIPKSVKVRSLEDKKRHGEIKRARTRRDWSDE